MKQAGPFPSGSNERERLLTGLQLDPLSSSGRTPGLHPRESRSESWQGNQETAEPDTVGAASGPSITNTGIGPQRDDRSHIYNGVGAPLPV